MIDQQNGFCYCLVTEKVPRVVCDKKGKNPTVTPRNLFRTKKNQSVGKSDSSFVCLQVGVWLVHRCILYDRLLLPHHAHRRLHNLRHFDTENSGSFQWIQAHRVYYGNAKFNRIHSNSKVNPTFIFSRSTSTRPALYGWRSCRYILLQQIMFHLGISPTDLCLLK